MSRVYQALAEDHSILCHPATFTLHMTACLTSRRSFEPSKVTLKPGNLEF
jgi:hypothetical protein